MRLVVSVQCNDKSLVLMGNYIFVMQLQQASTCKHAASLGPSNLPQKQRASNVHAQCLFETLATLLTVIHFIHSLEDHSFIAPAHIYSEPW